MNYVVSVIETIRVPNVNEVEKLHKELKNDNRFTLKKFEYQHKELKQKGEVYEEYELVKATLMFNIEKDPESYVEVDFRIDNGNFPGMGSSYSDDDNEEDEEDADSLF